MVGSQSHIGYIWSKLILSSREVIVKPSFLLFHHRLTHVLEKNKKFRTHEHLPMRFQLENLTNDFSGIKVTTMLLAGFTRLN